MNHQRIWRLRRQHRELERAIRDEGRARNPDSLILQDLKRRKLLVKDELFIAEAGLVPVTAAFHRA